MVIVKVERLRTRLPSVRIHLDDETSLTLSAETYLRSGMGRGDTVQRARLMELERADQRFQARRYAIHFLSFRPRSIREVTRYLTRKEFPNQVAGEVIADLEKLGMLDDVVFAGMFVRDAVGRGRTGPAMLKRKLLEKGVRPDVVATAIESHFPKDVQSDQAMRILQRRVERSHRSLARLDPQKRRARLYAYLLQRGFAHEAALKALQALTSGVEK